jgi:hypothetical protein
VPCPAGPNGTLRGIIAVPHQDGYGLLDRSDGALMEFSGNQNDDAKKERHQNQQELMHEPKPVQE